MDWLNNYLGETLLNYYDRKLTSMMNFMILNTVDLVTIIFVLYIVYLGYKMFFFHKKDDYTKLYVSIAIFTVIKLFWKIKFGI